MKILVTGGAGFIGSHLVKRLLMEGHSVTVVDNLSTGKLENVPSGAHFYHLDIRDKRLSSILIKENPQLIYHLAAQTSVPLSVADPAEDAAVNIMGSINLFHKAVENKVSKIIYSSTAAVYGVPESLPITEAHLANPISGYGLSKLTAEKYLQYYHLAYGIDYTILRYANVYGEGQDSNGEGGVVAQFMHRALKRERPKIFGDGRQTRDFIYVQDVVEANIRSMNKASQQTLHISTSVATSITLLWENIQAITGIYLTPEYLPPREGDIRNSVLDNKKAKQILEWSPVYDVNQGLRAYHNQLSGRQGA